jgi:hypothetical protein
VFQHRRDLLDFRRGALAERHAAPVVPVARVVEVAFDPVQQAVDAKGELVAHAHDDRVGLVPVLSAQMSERLAMLFGGLDHEAHIPSSRSTQRLAVEKDLDALPEFEAQRPEQPVFGIRDARGFSAANGIQGERDGLGIERLTVVDVIGVCTEPCR